MSELNYRVLNLRTRIVNVHLRSLEKGKHECCFKYFALGSVISFVQFID